MRQRQDQRAQLRGVQPMRKFAQQDFAFTGDDFHHPKLAGMGIQDELQRCVMARAAVMPCRSKTRDTRLSPFLNFRQDALSKPGGGFPTAIFFAGGRALVWPVLAGSALGSGAAVAGAIISGSTGSRVLPGSNFSVLAVGCPEFHDRLSKAL